MPKHRNGVAAENQENVSIGKSQKAASKKRKSIQDENNAPMIKVPGSHAPAASSVSIFHQVMSETPLRKKNP